VNRWLKAKEDEDLSRVFTATLESTIRSKVVEQVANAFGRQFTGATLEEYAKRIGLKFTAASIRVEGVPTQGIGMPELLRPYFEIPRTEEGANVLRGVLYLESLKNGESVGVEIPISRRPLLLSALSLFVRDLVDQLSLVIHQYELQDDSIHDVAAKLLHCVQLINFDIRNLGHLEFISSWLAGEIEIESSIGAISADCVSLYQSMEQMRLSLGVLLQVTQEEATSNNRPHYWRISHLGDRLTSMNAGLMETLGSIDLSENLERPWSEQVSVSIGAILQNYSSVKLDNLKKKLCEDLNFVDENLESNLLDQMKWVSINVDSLLSQSAFQTSRDKLVSTINDISENFDYQTQHLNSLKNLVSGVFNADEVIKHARDIDRITVDAERFLFLTTQLEYAVKRLNSMSSGGASIVIHPVIDFEKLTSLNDIAELGKE
jgi:hypothetical protein